MDKIVQWFIVGSPAHWELLALVVWMVFEDWLPKTNKFKANSTLQLIAQVLQLLLSKNVFVQGAARYLMAPSASQNPEQK